MDLFETANNTAHGDYSAKDIEVLEGLEPVRRRPGMYIGGTDERALHHLVAEVLDNAMDEAVAGHASRIELLLHDDYSITIADNGRGIPVDKHPKYKDKSALEVILTTLHSGGKFSNKLYATSGGLHGVGISVVNALSDRLTVEVARERVLWRQSFSRGTPITTLEKVGNAPNKRGTRVHFHPDPEIFGDQFAFKPAQLYKLARSKAYLFKGVEIRWSCDIPIGKEADIPQQENLHFPGGLSDYMRRLTLHEKILGGRICAGDARLDSELNDNNGENGGSIEWAISWSNYGDAFVQSYCNTVPTPNGGSHEAALRQCLTRGLRAYGEIIGNKKAASITAEDVTSHIKILLSIFIHDPQFQGQTKDKLSSPEGGKLVEQLFKDRFEQWLSEDPLGASEILDRAVEKFEERTRRRKEREQLRKTATRKLRLPGKLADCSSNQQEGTEIFLVEGDSAGGSAKQARDRKTQAILPLRGKILNVASSTLDKLQANQEIQDIGLALNCGMRENCNIDNLRYERVIIMTDADVDGAHIASLLLTFFYREMRPLIEQGHLFIAIPPLYRLSSGGKVFFARDDNHREQIIKDHFKNIKNIDISRFKGLGEMPPKQLQETTMNAKTRALLQVTLPNMNKNNTDQQHDNNEEYLLSQLVNNLMGKNPEKRYRYIQENASFIENIDV